MNPNRSAALTASAILSLFLLVSTERSLGQHDPYEVLFNGITSADTEIVLPVTSEELFLDPLSGEGNLFGDITRYGFSSVRYSRRGIASPLRSVSLLGVDLSGNLNSGAGYGLRSALNRSGLETLYQGEALWFTGSSLSVSRTSYGINAETVTRRRSVGVFTTDRKGRLGLKASLSGTVGEKWVYVADLYRRWGRDGAVKGVFTDKNSYAVALSRLFAGKHRITLVSTGEQGEDGLRSYVTDEVIELAGSNYYNPLWGYHEGKIRNGRVAGGFVPVTALSYRGDLHDRLSLELTVSYRGGREAVSGLSWLDAATPYPDYYRYLPSYASTQTAADIITSKWQAADPSVTQVDWEQLYRVNSLNSTTAVYTLSDRAEKVRDRQAFAFAAFRMDRATTLGFSLRARSDDVRRYRRMKDLLGGLATEDIDQYLYQDGIYGDRILNNAREPSRKVNRGDVFGYDYDIFASEFEGMFRAAYNLPGLDITGNVAFGYTAFRRRGNFEKEIYPGDLSYGYSEMVSYETYSAEIALRYAFTPSHSMDAALYGGRAPQQRATHFIAPIYSNARTEDTGPVTTIGGQGGYSYRSRTVRASACFYFISVKGRSELYNYWDDISSAYSAMHLKNAGQRGQGGEVAIECDLHPRWTVASALAIDVYKYSNDPLVDIYSENSLSRYVSDAKAFLKGYHTGSSPESIFTTKLSYNRRGFMGSLGFNYAGGRYVALSPLRRMQRAYNLALTDEAIDGFLSQEKLGDAFTVDLSLMKSFRVGKGYLSFFLSVSNLLNNRDIVYGAYEQMRIASLGSGVNARWVPFANKYLYSYGRTYYFSMTWSF